MKMARILLLVLVAAALGGALAACSSSDNKSTATPTKAATTAPAATATAAATPTEAAGEIDACLLVTKAEAEAALGVTVGEPARGSLSPRINGQRCEYASPFGTAGGGSVGVEVVENVDLPAAQKFFQDVKTKFQEGEGSVSGVGDEAFWAPHASSLFVLKDSVVFRIEVSFSGGGSSDKYRQAAITIALGVIGRLP